MGTTESASTGQASTQNVHETPRAAVSERSKNSGGVATEDRSRYSASETDRSRYSASETGASAESILNSIGASAESILNSMRAGSETGARTLSSSEASLAELKARRNQDEEARQLHAGDVIAAAKLKAIDAEAQKIKKERIAAAWQTVCVGLGTDPKSIRELGNKESRRGMVNLAYLVVIVGCELDLYGFAMALLGYWNLGRIFVQVMCIVGPIGYLLAVVAYMCFQSAAQDKIDAEKKKTQEASKPKTQLTYMQTAEPPSPQPQLNRVNSNWLNKKDPITIRYYHFLPIFRLYLVVKDKEIDDIEGVFRVNSLSSFSLGIAQICGIIFVALDNGGLDLFTWINAGSQCINWTITLLYFLTPIASRMGAAMKVEALVYNTGLRLRERWERYLHLVKEDAENGNTHTKLHLKNFQKALDNEITTMAKKSINLEPFSMEDKFNALRFLLKKKDDDYASI